jgi:hypothetical protein
MASPLFTKIDASGVSPMRLTKSASKPFCATGHSNKMNMVRHQAPSPYFNLIFLTPLGHQLDLDLIIIVAKKSLLTDDYHAESHDADSQ